MTLRGPSSRRTAIGEIARRHFPDAIILLLALLPALLEWPAAPLTANAVGRWLGWLGLGMIAASLLLMIREPRVAAWCGGLERMYRWHHGFGIGAYLAMLLHPLLLAAAHLPQAPVSAWAILSPLQSSWPNRLGWLALAGFMAGLAATFSLHLPYRLWRRLHLLMAPVVAIAMAHVLAIDGASITLWLTCAFAALGIGWRIFRTDRGGASRPYQVGAVTHPGHGVTEVSLQPLATSLDVEPGQFVMAAFFEGPRFHGCGEFHPYTVSRVHSDGKLTLSIKALGDCTRNLRRLQPGVAARVQGPFGRFLADAGEGPALWIGAGIGVTPFLARMRAAAIKHPVDFFYVHREVADTPHLPELMTLAASQPLLRFHSLAMQEDPSMLFEQLTNLVDLPIREVYLCGPPPLVGRVTDWLTQQGLRSDRIHFERFDFRG